MAAEAIKYSRLQSLCLQMNAAYEEHKIDQCDKIIDDIVRSKREIDFHLITEDTR